MASLSKLESNILWAMYTCGRGYGTHAILSKLLKTSDTPVQKALSSLRDRDFFKVSKIDNCYVYSLNKSVLDALKVPNRPPYLERMKDRNEDKALVMEKLRMLNFVACMNTDSTSFIHQYDKETILRNRYSISDKTMGIFTVKPGSPIHFNDVQYYHEESENRYLTIALFPRPSMYLRTFLKQYLIKQYIRLHIEFLMNKKNIRFIIAVHDEGQFKQCKETINTATLSQSITPSFFDSDQLSFIQEETKVQKLNTISERKDSDILIPISLFDLDTVCLEKTHPFL